jgi:aryl-alcohol dehydrogenase-like predicted oxidoreductase
VLHRTFGRNNGLRVAHVALGTANFGSQVFPGAGSGVGPDTARQIFEVYADAGGQFIDTAEAYQGGEAEQLIGQFVRSRRDDFVINSKFSVGRLGGEGEALRGNSRKAMTRAIDGTLQRLGTDYVDIYELHAYDAVTPIEEVVRAFDDLVRAGKILHGALGNVPAWLVALASAKAQARDLAPIAGISVEYGLAERSAERDLLPMAEALGLGVTAWSPLSSGFLIGHDLHSSGDASAPHWVGTKPAAAPTSKSTGDSTTMPPLPHWARNGRPNARDLQVRATVAKVAAKLSVSAARVGIAWLLSRDAAAGTAIVPILGARTPEHIRDTLQALDLQLPQAQLDLLDAASAPVLGEPHDHNAFHSGMTAGPEFQRPRHTVA